MTKPLNNFLETEHVELNKSLMFKELIQNLKMTPQNKRSSTTTNSLEETLIRKD